MLSSQVSSHSKMSAMPRSPQAFETLLHRTRSLPRRPRPYQQVRGFRLGLWSSYLDANFQREFRRRQRIVKHKYIEALNRKLSWDRHFPIHLRHSGLKGFICSAWRGQDSRPGGRWVNIDDLDSMKETSRDKNERGIEDVEQNALDHLLENHHKFIHAKSHMFGPGWSSSYSESWEAELGQNPKTPLTNDRTASSTLYGSERFRKRFQSREHDHEDEYEIDPITNRKVPRKTSQTANEGSMPVEIPVKTFKGYRSQSKDFEPPEAQPKCTESQSTSETTVTRERPSELHSRSSYSSKTSDQTQTEEVDPLAKYDAKVGLNSGRQYHPAEMDIDYSDPVQKGLKEYDDKISSEILTKTAAEDISSKCEGGQEGLEAYDMKADYESGRLFRNPNNELGPADPIQEAVKDYHFSKGTRPRKVIIPDKTDNEDRILKAKREYEHSASRRTFLRDQQANRLLQYIQNYEEIMSTERTRGHVTEASGHEHLHPLLRAIREYEKSMLDKRTDPHEAAGQDSRDPLLRAIREYKKLVSNVQVAHLGTAKKIEQEAVDPLLQAIHMYEAFLLERDARGSGDANDSVEECLKAYDSKVDFYRKPYESEIGDKKAGQYDSQRVWIKRDSANLMPSTGNRSDGNTESVDTLDSSTSPKSWAYLPQRIRELFATQAKSDSEVRNDSKTHETEGLLGASDAHTEEERIARRKQLEDDFKATQTNHSSSCAEEPDRLADLRHKYALDLKSEHNHLCKDAARIDSLIDAQLVELEKELQQDGKSRKMTGNYVRDFPDEFQAAWTTTDGGSGSLTRKNMSEQQLEAEIQESERVYINGMGAKEAFSSQPNVERIEPSLDRTISSDRESEVVGKETSHLKPNHAQEGDLSVSASAYTPPKQDESEETSALTFDPQLANDKNVQREEEKELVREVRSIYEDTYGTIDCRHRQTLSASEKIPSVDQGSPILNYAVETPEPTLYKILAYDPNMQSISSAETTSIVPDSSGPLTPAEVLLRLSNPAKFFPHFEPLRSQGYEIVSGSGDVLVFRKVRAGSPPEVKTSSPTPSDDKNALEHRRNVNPIDGMARGPTVATGDFASPTGFVNHDIPRGSEPPFKSNIDVRREEPVFSGKRNWENSEGGRKRGGIGKTVLIGAGWLAACSYAIGVVADYFKTGGADGQGPKGF